MIANIVVGIIFFGIVAFAAYKTIKAMRNNSCPGCSSGCSGSCPVSCSSNRRGSCGH